MATKLWALGLVAFCTILTTLAQVFYKFAAIKLSFNLASILFNYHFYIGVVLYIASFLILMIALKFGELSSLYPVFALSYVWVTLISGYLFNEAMNIEKWIGIGVIIIGITFIGFGSNRR